MHHDSDTSSDSRSESTLDRRSLLGILSASPFVLGLSELATGQDKQKQKQPQKRGAPEVAPEWFEAAKRRARQRGVPLIGFVTPGVDADEKPTPALRKKKAEFKSRLQALYNGASQAKTVGGKGVICSVNSWFTIKFEDRLARFAVYLQILLDSKNTDVRELFLDSVCVCAPAGMLGAENSETVVILDADGKRIGGDVIDLSDAAQFVSKLSNLIHGGGKLRERAEATRTLQVKSALSRLTASDARQVATAKAFLADNIQHCSAVVADERKNNKALRRVLGEVITSAYQRAVANSFHGVLPFGVTYEPRTVYDPCPPCGMARVPAGSRKMLKLLDK
jgi:hypothetical protein